MHIHENTWNTCIYMKTCIYMYFMYSLILLYLKFHGDQFCEYELNQQWNFFNSINFSIINYTVYKLIHPPVKHELKHYKTQSSHIICRITLWDSCFIDTNITRIIYYIIHYIIHYVIQMYYNILNILNIGWASIIYHKCWQKIWVIFSYKK